VIKVIVNITALLCLLCSNLGEQERNLNPLLKVGIQPLLNHNFNTDQLSLIKNANIRYECLDAKDDYHAQMQKNAGVLPVWEENNHDWDDIEAGSPSDTVFPINNDNESVPLDLLQLGWAELRWQQDIMMMRNIMTNLGWTRECHGTTPHPDVASTPIDCVLSSSAWKHEVDKKKQEVLEQQRQHMPLDETVTSSNICTPNIVKIADKSYLTKKLNTLDAQQTISPIVKEFGLNSKQEKAF
jgi:hypothetical protein